jgi:hypothetical protein
MDQGGNPGRCFPRQRRPDYRQRGTLKLARLGLAEPKFLGSYRADDPGIA